MEHQKPRLSLLPFLLPALAMPGLMASATIIALTPSPPDPETDEDPETSTAALETTNERIYFPIASPITVRLPESLERINIDLGVAIQKQDSTPLLIALADQAEALQAQLVQAVLMAAEALPAGANADDLRALLPETLRKNMNEKLATMGLEPSVEEVMITGWAIAR